MIRELRYDLRNPEPWRRDWALHYRTCLEQVEWADRHGFERVTLSEHHFSDDGYCPSSVTLAAAVAARTERIKIALSIILLPLKHPVQLAEELAILDIISGGRIEVGFGAGYRPSEFAAYGIPMAERFSRMEEAIEIVKRCWQEEAFDFTGEHWQLRDVRVQPKPVQRPRPKIVLGGSSQGAARRAARIADGFLATRREHAKAWADEMRALGRGDEVPATTPTVPRGVPSNFLLLADDPDAAWAVAAPHALHESNSYGAWTRERGQSPYVAAADADALRESGTYGVLSPVALADAVIRHEASGATARVVLHPMMGGLPLDLGWSSVRLLVERVDPQVAAASASA